MFWSTRLFFQIKILAKIIESTLLSMGWKNTCSLKYEQFISCHVITIFIAEKWNLGFFQFCKFNQLCENIERLNRHFWSYSTSKGIRTQKIPKWYLGPVGPRCPPYWSHEPCYIRGLIRVENCPTSMTCNCRGTSMLPASFGRSLKRWNSASRTFSNGRTYDTLKKNCILWWLAETKKKKIYRLQSTTFVVNDNVKQSWSGIWLTHLKNNNYSFPSRFSFAPYWHNQTDCVVTLVAHKKDVSITSHARCNTASIGSLCKLCAVKQTTA